MRGLYWEHILEKKDIITKFALFRINWPSQANINIQIQLLISINLNYKNWKILWIKHE